MKISRLRLLGFKSFVEPTELVVSHGLTGVVGPNGCGKSNLLEALRWVMGETSYKSMRASAMDDVIFSGTEHRPARNMAEVSIFLDNSERLAPAEFNDSDVVEVTRRIEREAGSAYKVNSKDVRARDVRLLFEDAATGARSPALVRQGRIGEIVNARPQERRRILEDAAGIAGLHSRRHEAELRLKGAESNLERLQDVMGQLGSQLQSLKRQARQARRYKDMSSKIKEAEAAQHHLQWTSACAAVTEEETLLRESTSEVGQLTQNEAAALRAQSEAADTLQPLRDEEATRAAVLHRLTVERETLDQEEARAKARQEELESRLEQLATDFTREQDIMEEAAAILATLEAEETQLQSTLANSTEAEPAAREEAEHSADALHEAEETLSAVTDRLAEMRARRRQIETNAADARAQIAALGDQGGDIDEQLAVLGEELSETADFARLSDEVDRLAGDMARIEAEVDAAEAAHAEARDAERVARDTADQAKLRAQELETEVQTLVKLLKPADAEQWEPVLNDTRAAPGYERALGAALGEDLEASADSEAPVRWGGSAHPDGDPALPGDATPLSEFVTAPAALTRRLRLIGVVERAEGPHLQAQLKPGQRLVSLDGDLWRWDGYTAVADAPTAAATRLAERNRLDDLTAAAEEARSGAATADAARVASSAAVVTAEDGEKQCRQRWRAAQSDLGRARDALAEAEHAAQDSNKRLGALTEARSRTADALAEAQQKHNEAEAGLADIGPSDALEAELERQRENLNETRAAYTEARAALDGLEHELRLRQERLETIAQERQRWTKRTGSATEQIERLTARKDETREELASMADLPDQVAERRNRLLSAIADAEAARQQAGDALAQADGQLKNSETALRELQGTLSNARETRARVEARLEAARERRSEQARTIRDRLNCAPEDCLKLAGLEPDDELPALIDIEARLAKFRTERERLGGVNLRAEEEAEELSEQLGSMETEREDLEQAIARLRQGIASLNREGRQRLLEAFDEVNAHFEKLFVTLFGGGKAELQLVESDDPLESGLEILACPPGKKPQVLTLLSGGEKALTAMALIFAVFLTNPSPICVLDEVDAPLDDTNVERFCNLMDEMSRSTDTRFLIITHHPMTMARVDRLFGVTMAERGISQLVSVDLETAEQYRQAG
ncbi:MAG: chromosome segregation protein SMC [Methyloligellaceae bacterium]